jgi:hypothetical protein
MRAPGRSCDENQAWRKSCMVQVAWALCRLMLDRYAVGTILSKLVFLISVPSLHASEPRNGDARRVRVGIDNENDQVT